MLKFDLWANRIYPEKGSKKCKGTEKMTIKNKILFVTSFLSCLLFINMTIQNQIHHWKGTVEEDNGIKVIKNPNEPFYGEIDFELEEDLSIGNEKDENYRFYRFVRLEVDSRGNIFALDGGNCRIQKFDKDGNYLQTIGRKGQGPGEFNRPLNIHLDEKKNIYAIEAAREIQIFDRTGKFKNSIPMIQSIRDFSRGIEGNFLAQTSTIDQKDGKTVMLDQVSLLDSKCKKLKTIVSLPRYMPPPPPEPMDIGKAYVPELVFSPLNEGLGIYAISSEYKFHVINSSGDVSHTFTKDKSLQSFSKEEKDNIINTYRKSMARLGREENFSADFPKHKPLIRGILNDSLGRIYVHKYQIIPTADRKLHFDVFNKEGYYLYKMNLPVFPQVIKSGYLYSVQQNSDTGYVIVKRYKIKNWDHIKEGIK